MHVASPDVEHRFGHYRVSLIVVGGKDGGVAGHTRWEDIKARHGHANVNARAAAERESALGELVQQLRTQAGMSSGELAKRSRTTAAAIERIEGGGGVSRLDTLERVAGALGTKLVISMLDRQASPSAAADPHVSFAEVKRRRGRPMFVPDRLWRLSIEDALVTVELPLALNWSQPGTRFQLHDRTERARCYEIVLREGMPADIVQFVDGALLIDLWDELVLPSDLRAAWQLTIDGR
jgi:transcriptional regulator with XRE-family HTH domain